MPVFSPTKKDQNTVRRKNTTILWFSIKEGNREHPDVFLKNEITFFSLGGKMLTPILATLQIYNSIQKYKTM